MAASLQVAANPETIQNDHVFPGKLINLWQIIFIPIHLKSESPCTDPDASFQLNLECPFKIFCEELSIIMSTTIY